MKKSDLQPADGAVPNYVALDKTVIQLNDDRYWLYAAVAAKTGRLLHVKLAPTGNQEIASMFLAELREQLNVEVAIFLVDFAQWFYAAGHRHDLRFQG